MAKPVTLPLWATDTTNTTIGAVENGQTVKLEPSLGVKQQGWIAGEEAPARWMNWLLNNIYTWAVYLDGLATDTQFLANDFAFTGEPTFTSIEVGDFECTGTFEVSAISPHFTSTVKTDLSFTSVQDHRAGGDFYFVNGAGVVTPKSHKIQIQPPSNDQWIQFPSSDAQTRCTSVNKSVAVKIPVPRECRIRGVLVQVSSTGGGSAISCSVTKVTPSTAIGAAAAPASTFVTSGNNASAAGFYGINMTMNQLVDENSFWYLSVTSSNTADPSNPDTIHSITVTFDDAGPRNGA